MHPIQQLTFRGANRVRVFGTTDAPLFVATDVCSILGLGNASLAINGNPTRGDDGLDDDEKGIYSVETEGGRQNMLCVTEAGLYSLIFKSRRPEAKAFKKWVTSEVLPAIRKHGRYEIEQQARSLAFKHFLAEVPTEWQETFSADWFAAILGVYGLDHVKGRTPGFVGTLINDYIYEPLVAGLPAELKARREIAGKGGKLHQFLKVEARQKLSEHLAVVKALALNNHGHPDGFRESFDRVFNRRDQLLLTLASKTPRAARRTMKQEARA